jgi:hypothetical protein
MRKLIGLTLGVVMLGLVAVALISALPAGLPSQSQLLSATELASVGISLEPVPREAHAAVVSEASAIEIAQSLDGRTDTPAEVIRAMIPGIGTGLARSSYLVIFKGGPDIPGGPNGDMHPVRFRGVVVDDQSGAYIRGFYL